MDKVLKECDGIEASTDSCQYMATIRSQFFNQYEEDLIENTIVPCDDNDNQTAPPLMTCFEAVNEKCREQLTNLGLVVEYLEQ